jgi:hypothetical protein
MSASRRDLALRADLHTRALGPSYHFWIKGIDFDRKPIQTAYAMCPRVLRNRGRLISREENAEYDVTFEFQVDSGSSAARPGRYTIWGEVSTADRMPLPEGEYVLHVHSGETLQVENTGLTGWRVITEPRGLG